MNRLLLSLLLMLSSTVARAGDIGVFVLADDMSLAGHSFGNALATEDFASGTGTWTTTNLEIMAANGVTLSNLYSYVNCAPTRAALLAGSKQGTHANPFGDVYRSADTITPAADFVPYVETIVTRFQAAGGKVAFFGKPHMNPSWDLGSPAESWAAAMNFDHAEKLLWHASDVRNYAGSGDSFDNADLCYGHNLWVSDNTTLETSYLNDVVFDAAEAFIANTAQGDAADWLVIVATFAPHGPTNCGTDGVGVDSCSGSTVCDGGTARDDRPSGCTATNNRDVVGCHLAEVDSRIATIKALLSLDPATGTDWIGYSADNGSADRGASDECLIDSESKLKSSVYPCGVRVGAVFEGAGITAAGAIMPGLYAFEDLSATLLGLMGYTGALDPTSRSFAACLRDATPSNCWSRESVVVQRWRPNGGLTDGSIRGQPRTDGGADEYLQYQIGAYTRVGGVLRLVVRLIDTSSAPIGGVFAFDEEFYDLTSGDLYADTAEAVSFGNALVSGDFTGPTADQLTALAISQRALDGQWANEGFGVPVLRGGTR